MPAPSSSSILRLLALTGLAALVLAGCTVPGSSRLEGPPKGLPAVMSSVPADVVGFSLVDTSEDRWERLDAQLPGLPMLAVRETFEETLGSPASSWGAGRVAGIGIRSLDDAAPARRFLFASVSSRDALENDLEAMGWKATGETWTRDEDEGEFAALKLVAGGLIAAADRAALQDVLAAADDYAVSERKAMSRYTVDAMARSPLAFVFRTDVARLQVRHWFADDPALLEFARWATSADTINAMRDGWIGVVPGPKESIRLVGQADWVPDLAADIDLQPVDRRVLDELTVEPELAVAVHDPGQFAVDAVKGITGPGIGFVTDGDVEEGKPKVELLPALEALDGDGAIGWSGDAGVIELRARAGDADDAAADLAAVADHVGIESDVSAFDGGVTAIVSLDGSSLGAVPQGRAPIQDTLDAAGKPSRRPIAWFYSASRACFGPSGGWLTWDGTERMSYSLALPVEDANCIDLP